MKKNYSEMVSVIMATYKTDENILLTAVNSILNQTYKNLELIIVCDGDTENYMQLKSIKDNRLVLILNKSNLGLAASLNVGIQHAKGEYIARMDSDDISLENRIMQQVKYIKKHKNIQLVSMSAKCFGDSSSIKRNFWKNSTQIYTQLLYENPIIHPSVLLRKSYIYDKNLYYNESFTCSQDYELWSKLITKNNTKIMPQIGLLYRVHNKQASIAKRKIQQDLRKKVIKQLLIRREKDFEDSEEFINYLTGEKDINKKNYNKICSIIDEKFDKKEQKILYNRIFQLLLSTYNWNIIRLLRDIKCFKIYKMCNVLYIGHKILMFLQEKMIGNRRGING